MRIAYGISPGAMTFKDGHVAALDDLSARAELGELTGDEVAELVPAPIARVRATAYRADAAETRLDESRRMRRMAEEITGNRRGEST